MLTRLIIENAHVSLLCDALGFNHRRPLRLDGLANMTERYAVTRERGDAPALLSLRVRISVWVGIAAQVAGSLRSSLQPKPTTDHRPRGMSAP
jgi:hypothetical protein